ncbi:MAG: hypothetical protein AAFV77_04385, partial [Planctomycetota bacterium]
MDDDAANNTPPTTPGPIRTHRRLSLPAQAIIVAILDILLGGLMVLTMFSPPFHVDVFTIVFASFAILGIGVLLRSNVVRVLSIVAHA